MVSEWIEVWRDPSEQYGPLRVAVNPKDGAPIALEIGTDDCWHTTSLTVAQWRELVQRVDAALTATSR